MLEFIAKTVWLRMLLLTLVGAGLGFAYYKFVGCHGT